MHDTLDTPSDRRKDQDALKEVLGDLMPPSHAIQLGHAERVELDTERKFRTKNKASYRLNHWPIWIWTFFIAPGPLTFDLFAHGFDWRMAAWLGVVLVAHRRRGLFRPAARRRAGALHHPLHRGPAEPALSARLLHVRRGAPSSRLPC